MKAFSASAAGRWEPQVTAVFLPRCPSCHAPHPQAMRPPRFSDTCPACDGLVAAAGAPKTVKAKLTGLHPAVLVAGAFLAIGDFLRNLSKGL